MPNLPLIWAMLAITAVSGLTANVFKKAKASELLYQPDGKSIWMFRLIYPGSLLLSAILVYHGISVSALLNAAMVNTAAILLFASGITIRWVAILSLKRYFTVKISILKDHKLKTNGLYALVRHPSYSGLILQYLGIGLAMHSFWLMALLQVGVWSTLLLRLKLEEAALEAHFGAQWKTYAAHTKRLIPFVY